MAKIEKSDRIASITCSTHPSMRGTGLHCTDRESSSSSSYPTSSSRGGDNRTSSSHVNSTTSSNTSFTDIIKKTSNPQSGTLLLGEKVINISNSNLKDEEIGVLVQYIKYQALNLDKFDASNNQLGFTSVENLFYTFRLGSPTAYYNIRTINLSNNLIGDDGAKYIAKHLEAGLYPNLKALDLSGNQLTATGEGYIAKALQNPKVQNMFVTLEKYATLERKDYYGKFLKGFLKHAEQQGINTKNVVVSKSLWTDLKEKTLMSIKVGWGYVKCKIDIPTTAPEIAVDAITIVSKNKFLVGLNDTYCFTTSLYDNMLSPEGIGIVIRDLELMGVDAINTYE